MFFYNFYWIERNYYVYLTVIIISNWNFNRMSMIDFYNSTNRIDFRTKDFVRTNQDMRTILLLAFIPLFIPTVSLLIHTDKDQYCHHTKAAFGLQYGNNCIYIRSAFIISLYWKSCQRHSCWFLRGYCSKPH